MPFHGVAKVLLVEDNPGHAAVIREILREGDQVTHVRHVEDGTEALDLLRGQGDAAPPYRPHIVILDLDLPGTEGIDVLAEMKKDPELEWIPVVVLTGERPAAEIVECYAQGANCFVPKPDSLEGLSEAIQRLVRFWFTTAKLPKRR